MFSRSSQNSEFGFNMEPLQEYKRSAHSPFSLAAQDPVPSASQLTVLTQYRIRLPAGGFTITLIAVCQLTVIRCGNNVAQVARTWSPGVAQKRL